MYRASARSGIYYVFIYLLIYLLFVVYLTETVASNKRVVSE
jgi:hypothetical protein